MILFEKEKEGGVASLCIVEPGTYEYRVNQIRSDKSFLHEGKILVR
ncbi:MAG: hypothetical protein HY576_07425 [candidate division NC10 bacterium]|nr:hypothetical protein [candidate division NC10 bacterium]